MKSVKQDSEKSLMKNYVIGFTLSLVLTFIAFGLVWFSKGSYHEFISRNLLISTLALLASIQLIVQVVFFLHMSTERKVRWSLLSLVFAGSMILVIVIGSIWVMNNLNYNMMPDMKGQNNQSITDYIEDKEAVHVR